MRRPDSKAVMTGGALGLKAVSLGDLDEFLDWLVSEENTDEQAQQLYKAVAWTFWCANLRADSVAQIPFAVYPMGVEDDEEGKEQEWGIDMRRTLWTVEAWLCLKAAAYVLKRDKGGMLDKLQVLNANTMRVKAWDDDGPTQFEQRVGAQRRLFSAEELLYFRTFDPSDDIREGIASGQVGRRSASLIKAANEWAAAFFRNGAIPAVFLTTEGAVPPVEKTRIQKAWEQMLKGVQRAFKTTVLERGLTPTVIGQPIKDLAMPDLDKSQKEQILAAHKIPPGLAEAKTNRAERDSLQFELWTQCIIPECEVWIEPVLNEQLFNPLGLRLSFHYQEIEVLQREEIAKAESMAFAINGVILPAYEANLVSVKEARSWIDNVGQSAGLPPLEEQFEPEERTPPQVQVAQMAGNNANNQQGPGTSASQANIENRTQPKAVDDDPFVSAPAWGHHRISLPS
jgi:HK97 family phage portal protein